MANSGFKMYGLSEEIWNKKYRYQGTEKIKKDDCIEESWKRVATSIAEQEEDSEYWAQEFYKILTDFKFLPGGRILANAGTSRDEVTMFNCYVMNNIPDSIDGIFDTVKDSALTQKQGGGVGYDFSTLRPSGSHIKGCEAESSGPLSFMQVLDSTCRTIMSAGQRRGAQMGVMRCDHPDIEAFIAAKRGNNSLQMFNLSVAITDKFVEAVKNNENWELVFDGDVYKTIRATELWDSIMKSTYDYAEPGFLLIDRINEMNNMYYCEDIRATNPCVTDDTWVQTDKGPLQVKDLINCEFTARINGVDYPATKDGFFKTATKQVVELETKDGFKIKLTQDHKVKKITKLTRDVIETEWVEVGTLSEEDSVLLNNHKDNISWSGINKYKEKDGYLMGLLIGDGSFSEEQAVLSVWKDKNIQNDEDLKKTGAYSMMQVVDDAVVDLNKRSDFTGWHEIKGRSEYRLSLSAITEIAKDLDVVQGNKIITDEIEKSSSDFYKGFIKGMFDADGSVQGTQEKGISVRLAQSNLKNLEAMQRMLMRLGINSKIYKNRREAGQKMLPDGKGGEKLYDVKAEHELVISKENLIKFNDVVGFNNIEKQNKLNDLIQDFKREPNRERFVSQVKSISELSSEDVYDVQVPGINSFDGNGIVCHNCGEQPLPPYGACLLGSLNLTRFVSAPFTKNAKINFKEIEKITKIAVRLLDNVIDMSNYPLAAQRFEAESKRRMGLGITGLADLLIFMGQKYGSAESLKTSEKIMKTITCAAYEASVELSKEKGAFPKFDANQYVTGEFIKTLPEKLKSDIAIHGLRNSHLTSIAPTGTISLLAGNISSGLEPIFAFKYTRKIRNKGEDDISEVEVSDYAYRMYREFLGVDDLQENELPEYFISSDGVTPTQHVDVQVALQKWVDSSISKTINVPADYDFEDFKDIYMQAAEKGLKGCTTFRPSEHIAGVLIKSEDKKIEKSKKEEPTIIVNNNYVKDRPRELEGTTYKIKTPLSPDALYVTVNDMIEDDGRRRPYELFINTKNLQHFSWIVAMTRLISAVFRHEPEPRFLVQELKSIYDPNGGYFSDGGYVPSLAADIGRVIEKHLNKIGIIKDDKKIVEDAQEIPSEKTSSKKDDDARYMFCPQCSEKSLISAENCLKCLSCGYSKCG